MLEDVKVLLGIANNIADEMLEKIIEISEERLAMLLGEMVPPELEYIVKEVSVIRYNRIGSEGSASHSVEGESWSFGDDDFAQYQNDIAAWRGAHRKGGKVRLL